MIRRVLMTVFLAACSNAWAEPGGTYILTGQEKNIAEIIKADMAKFPELYEGESLDGYIAKFKRKNRIGSRALSPGDTLYFPETAASRKAEKARMEEERARAEEIKEQQERLIKEIIDSFTEHDDTGWLPDATFRELVEAVERKGFWSDAYWVTAVDGRCNENGSIEYRFRYEPIPDGPSRFYWWFSLGEEEFDKKAELYKGMGFMIVHEQNYLLPNGEKRYQAVWHKYEG